jgi:pyruvate/2-oxoglutarate dehydrogenase complex dihydrolipoamide acyltransferase (E2) component
MSLGAETIRRSKQGVAVRQAIPFVAMKKMIGDHLLASHQQVPAVSVFADLDVDQVLALRKTRFADMPQKVTLTHILLKAVAEALKVYPLLNATLSDAEILVLDEINIGVAVALADGNLIVPVIRNVDHLSVAEIAQCSNELAQIALKGRLGLDDVRGGTFTLSNVGSVPGTLWQTPLINPPQSGTLALGRARAAAVVREGEIVVGQVMGASLTFDHRVISGLPASEFMAHLAELLRKPEPWCA